jgi:hypothetical protein
MTYRVQVVPKIKRRMLQQAKTRKTHAKDYYAVSRMRREEMSVKMPERTLKRPHRFLSAEEA